MASSGNFAVFNPLANTTAGVSYAGSVYSNGNTRFRGNTGGTATTQLTHGLTSGKWYIEFYIDGSPAGGFPMIGIVASGADSSTLQNTSNAAALTITSDLQTVNGDKRVFGSTSGTSYGSGFSDGDICQMAIDIDNGKVWWGKNNTFFASGDPGAGSNAGDTFTGGTEMMVFVGSYSGAAYTIVNAGQDDTFGGNVTAAGNADGNGFGVFKYSPPTGYLALCSANLPISDDIDPAQTDDEYIGGKQFHAVEYTGNSTTGQSITGMGFKPDLLWCKMTSSSQNNQLFDSSRLNTRGTPTPFMIRTDTNAAEIDDQAQGNNNPMISSFDNDGFTLGTSGSGPNDNARTYIAMGWKANGGTTVSNESGDITSAVQANTKSGFSIVTYTGNGGVAQSIGHGLSSGAPNLIFVKNRDATDDWAVYHHSLGNAAHLILNSTAGQVTSSAYWGSFTPTTSLFKVGSDHKLNASGEKYVAYLWHEVEGFSKFGTYSGTGNNDGTFVYLGFKPKFIFFKRVNTASVTYGYPTFLDIVNDSVNDQYFDGWWLDQTVAASGNYALDFLSNGFKHRNSNTNLDASGSTYIYAAWGSTPFKYSNSF